MLECSKTDIFGASQQTFGLSYFVKALTFDKFDKMNVTKQKIYGFS